MTWWRQELAQWTTLQIASIINPFLLQHFCFTLLILFVVVSPGNRRREINIAEICRLWAAPPTEHSEKRLFNFANILFSCGYFPKSKVNKYGSLLVKEYLRKIYLFAYLQNSFLFYCFVIKYYWNYSFHLSVFNAFTIESDFGKISQREIEANILSMLLFNLVHNSQQALVATIWKMNNKSVESGRTCDHHNIVCLFPIVISKPI